MEASNKTIIIKLGGSAVSTPEKMFDFDYLGDLKESLMPQIENGMKFFIVLGGGHVMRKYRDLAVEGGVSDTTQLHWIGTTVNVLHAVMSKAYFSDLADEDVIKFEDYYDDTPFNIQKSLKFGGGGRPGHSGDVDAVLAAKKLNAKAIISLKNVDGVYNEDPKKNPDAQLMDNLSWDEYLDIIGNKTEHEPGGNYPIDPIASRMSKEAGLEFDIVGYTNLGDLSKSIKGESFKGTRVG